MKRRFRLGLYGLVLGVVALSACGSPPPSSGASRSANPQQAQRSGSAKRISAAIRSQPASIVQQRTQRSVGSLRGLDAIEEITNAGLTMLNGDGVRVPLLAEAVPTV